MWCNNSKMQLQTVATKSNSFLFIYFLYLRYTTILYIISEEIYVLFAFNISEICRSRKLIYS